MKWLESMMRERFPILKLYYIFILPLVFICTLLQPLTAEAGLPNRYNWEEYQLEGEALFKSGELPEAEKKFLKAKTELVMWGQQNADLAKTLNHLGVLYLYMGRWDNAESYLQQSLKMRETVLGDQHKDVAVTLFNLSELFRLRGRMGQAETFFQQAMAIDPATVDPHEVTVSLSTGAPLSTTYSIDKYLDPYLSNKPLPTVFNHAVDKMYPQFSTVITEQALRYLREGKYVDAEATFMRALRLEQKQYGYTTADFGKALNNLAVLYDTQGRYKEAEPLYQQALFLLNKRYSSNHPDFLRTFNNLKVMYLAQGQVQQASQLAERFFPTPIVTTVPVSQKTTPQKSDAKKPSPKSPKKKTRKR